MEPTPPNTHGQQLLAALQVTAHMVQELGLEHVPDWTCQDTVPDSNVLGVHLHYIAREDVVTVAQTKFGGALSRSVETSADGHSEYDHAELLGSLSGVPFRLVAASDYRPVAPDPSAALPVRAPVRLDAQFVVAPAPMPAADPAADTAAGPGVSA